MRRIGVAFPGGDPSSPATWSGTPAGLITGLQEIGYDSVPLRVGAPDLVRAAAVNAIALAYLRPSDGLRASIRRARGTAKATPLLSTIDTRLTPANLGESERLDAIVQIGTGFTLRTTVPIVTYEDMTVAQNREHPYEQFTLLSDRAMNARIRRQRDVYRQAVACCLATDWAAASVATDYGVPPQKIHVVGVGCHPIFTVGDRDWSAPRFLFVGIDWERKNGPGVLRAFERLRKRIPNARLDVVGQHPPLDQQGVTGHGVLNRDNPAERRKVEELFGTATCFVMPSHLEAAGIAYVEALAAGIPAIGTKVGGSAYMIGDAGTTIDPDSDDELLDAMFRFTEPDIAAEAGARGRQHASRFTWPLVAQRVMDALV